MSVLLDSGVENEKNNSPKQKYLNSPVYSDLKKVLIENLWMQSKRQKSIFSLSLQNSSFILNLHLLSYLVPKSIHFIWNVHRKKFVKHIQGAAIKLCIIITDPASGSPQFRIFSNLLIPLLNIHNFTMLFLYSLHYRVSILFLETRIIKLSFMDCYDCITWKCLEAIEEKHHVVMIYFLLLLFFNTFSIAEMRAQTACRRVVFRMRLRQQKDQVVEKGHCISWVWIPDYQSATLYSMYFCFSSGVLGISFQFCDQITQSVLRTDCVHVQVWAMERAGAASLRSGWGCPVPDTASVNLCICWFLLCSCHGNK